MLVQDEEANLYDSLDHNQKLFKFKQGLAKCESKKAKFVENLKSERFQEPRMFTMDQIRNMVYSCLNQSTAIERI